MVREAPNKRVFVTKRRVSIAKKADKTTKKPVFVASTVRKTPNNP